MVSLTTMIVLAATITWLFSTTLQRQAIQDGEKVANSFVTLGVQSTINDQLSTFWTDPKSVPPVVQIELDKLGSANHVAVLHGLTLYTTDGEALYYQGGDVSTAPAPDAALMDAADRL